MKLIFLLSLLCCQIALAQPGTEAIVDIKQQPIKVIMAEAEQLYNDGLYQEAYPYYKALKEMRKRSNLEDNYRLGKTALVSKEYVVSKEALHPLLHKSKNFPLIHYEYALALKYQGEYILANQHFQSYLNNHGSETNNDYVELAQKHLKTCQKILQEREKTSNWSLGYFEDKENAEPTTYRAVTKMSKYNVGLIECQTPQGTCIKKIYPDNRIELLRGAVGNPLFNTSSPYIAPDGETVYFAQQEIGKAEHHIFTGRLAANGEIIDIKKLGPNVNRVGYSSTHPTLGITEKGQEILYFASTLPGTQGGYDIWYTVKTIDGSFTRAYNLGTRINGEGDDITPYYYQQANELYFSSEKPQGYGGLDVYKMTGEKKRWEEGEAKHLQNPVNSRGNDFHFKKTSPTNGSFSTDRKNGKEQMVKYKKTIGA